jgi:hypothetical protein
MTLSYSIDAMKTGLYEILGKVLAMVIILGGQAPAMFIPAIADYFVYDNLTRIRVGVDDVPVAEIRRDLKKVWPWCIYYWFQRKLEEIGKNLFNRINQIIFFFFK